MGGISECLGPWINIIDKTFNLHAIENDLKRTILNEYSVKDEKFYSIGGRVLNITSLSNSLAKARSKSLENINKINWIDGFFRKDIGWRVINRK